VGRPCGWWLRPPHFRFWQRAPGSRVNREMIVVRIRITQRGLDAEEMHMHAFLSVEAASRWMSRFLARRLPEAFERAMGVSAR